MKQSAEHFNGLVLKDKANNNDEDRFYKRFIDDIILQPKELKRMPRGWWIG